MSKNRTNKTAHRRAAEDPQVQVLIGALRFDWEKIDRVTRGERLRQLAERGCSTRGLGEALGQSATSVRTHMNIAALPEKDREAVRTGASAKKILGRKAEGDRLRKVRERVALDLRTGELSDRLADVIIAFCQTVDRVPKSRILEGEFDTFLGLLRSAFNNCVLFPVKLPKRLKLKQRFLRTRPRVEGDPLFMAYRAEWLATLLLSEAPELPIRERAIEKAE
jgi:hypothetical protein